MLINQKYLGKNLAYLRKKAGLKQSEIYDRLGIRATTWGMYEINKSQPNLDVLIHISKFFGISESDLLHIDLDQKGNLNEKIDIEKIQQKRNLNSNLNSNLIAEKKENEDALISDKNAFNHRLNEGDAGNPSLKAQVHVLSSNIAKLEANISKRIAQMEDKINALEKGRSKK